MAAAAYYSSSSSSSSCGRGNYDVFLSFRGTDTRQIFVCHLYNALERKSFTTFIDNVGLKTGDALPVLLNAIDQSKLSVVVLSENYASSYWCLTEVAKIVECMNTKKQIVVPIFYHVDPADVRHQRNSFMVAFAKHQLKSRVSMEEQQRWKSALTLVANVKGWESQKFQDDAKLIDCIVKDIIEKLTKIGSSESNDLVGMDAHIKKMESLMEFELNDVRTVGIWGMGGIGKTTIARAVYDKWSRKFEACCFLENVRKRSSIVQMQEELLFRILKEKVRNLGTLNIDSELIKEMLSKKKIFVVLDDVDSLDQVEDFLGTRRSFGDGSKIIITTRDRSFLSESKMYDPDFMEKKEALELFRKYAKPSTQYDHLLSHAINYAQGLPLALRVLGASLHNKSICEWKDEFEKIKKFPNKGIGAVLRTSYEGLDVPQKKIFLDVACFFRGIQKDYATLILDACGLYPISGLSVLVDRALVTTSGYYEVLGMHDLLQDMAFEIVRQESKPSRLTVSDAVEDVLAVNTDTEAVESIDLDLYNLKYVDINAEAFASMKKLRLLRIHYNRSIDTVDDYYCSTEELYHPSDECKQEVSGELKFISHELRCLIWHGYPLKSLPSNFRPKHLVDLDMRGSLIEKLWKGTKPLEKLKCINLSRSPYLIETPDLTKATNLEKVNLEACISLSEVHTSISDLQNLIFLSLKGCKELKNLPSSFCMKSLKTLELSGCSNLENFPEIPEVMKELPCLCLDGTAIKKLPSSISNLTGLVTLSLKDCRELESLPGSICRLKSLTYVTLSGCSKFEVFPNIAGVEDMEVLRELHLDGTSIKELFFPSSLSLKILSLSECKELKSLPSSIYMPFLKTLILSGCSKLQKFPEISVKMEYLSELNLDDIAIEELPSSIKNLCQLKSLSLKDCGELKSLPSSIFQLDFLREIIVSGCLKFEVFPKIEEELNMDQTSTKMFSPLENLITLRLEECEELRSLPSSICQLKSLRYFALSGCSKFEEFPEILDDMEELRELHLNGTSIKELFPSIVRLKRLILLNLRNCRSLVRLPNNICNLSHLTGLTLSGCSNLCNLPNNFRNLQSLQDLEGEGSGIEQDLNISHEWEDDLKDRHTVQLVLTTGFDGLHYSERNIFLDVAWFFKGMKKGYVTKVLYSCGFFPYSAFKVLLDSSLVAISARDGTLEIHNLLQETVRDFVREENEHEPGKRSRLHGHEGINCLSDQNTVTETVEVITLDLSNAKEVSFNAEAFVTMKKLRLLQILDNGSIHCKQHFSGDFKFISHELRCLIWHRYPLKSLPSNFHPKNLVDLDMRFSRLKQLWKGTKPLKNVAFINLSHSPDLKKTPDLTEAENLEKLNLEGCTSLSEVHSSIFCLKNLDFLSLKGCRELKILPSRIDMKSLKTLDLSGCSNLKKFPEISGIMMELSDIDLDETAIKKLPSSIERLQGLTSLSMRNCRRLVSLPDSICSLANLQQLYLDGCSKLSKFPVNLRNKKSLTVSGIEELPFFIRNRETESEGVSEVLQGRGEESDGKEEKEEMEGGVSGMLGDLGDFYRSLRQLCRRELKEERD